MILIPAKQVKVITGQSIQNNNDFLNESSKCVTCGKSYPKQKGFFRPTKSSLFRGNDGYLPVCNKCLNNQLKDYVDELGDEIQAIKRVCLHWDIYFSESLAETSRKGKGVNDILSAYIKNLNLGQYGNSYDDTLNEEKADLFVSTEETQVAIEKGEINIGDATLKRWDVGLTNDEDYKTLDSHYKMLKKQNPNCDSNQEIFIKDLCYIKLWQMKILKENGKADDFKKLTDLYRETFKQAGLKTVQETDSSNDEVLGVTLATISQFTPEEYYKDQKLYSDFDGIGDYFSRFILRPLKNLMTGSTDRDKKYCVKDDDQNG